MRQLRKAFIRILSITALLLSGLAATAPSAQAAVPDRWGFALVDVNSGTPSLTYQAGSWPAGFNVTVSPGSPGQTYVRFPQIASAKGVVHVTAVTDNPIWCQVQKWAPVGPDELAVVQCYKYGGGPVFVPFSIVFAESSGALSTVSSAFGTVVWNGSGIASQYNSVGAVNTVTPMGTGAWLVNLPGLGTASLAGNVQVTAVDPIKPARCKVGKWGSTPNLQQVVVLCHDVADNPYNTGWTLTYHRARAVTGGLLPPKYFAYTFDNNPANPGPYAPAPAGVNFNHAGAVNTVQTAGPGMRLVIFPDVGIKQTNVQVTAVGGGPEYCNLLTKWINHPDDTIVRDVVCYKGVTRLDQPSLVTQVSAY